MKRGLGVAVVALVIAAWAGIRAWPSASVAVNNDTVIAIVLGVNLVLCLSVWYWARPRAGAVKAMPFVALLMVAMLLGLLPRLFWPAADGIHVAGTVASLIVTTGMSVMQVRRILTEIRRRRSLRHGAGAA
jgi:magnesium-transporting ATPase (P-type)